MMRTPILTGYDSPIGTLVISMDGDAIVGVRFGTGGDALPEPPEHIADWFDRYFSGERQSTVPEYRLDGVSDFARTVYTELSDVGYGEVCTYGELADRMAPVLGRRTSPRAVGAALGRNPILILVPCHRVVGSGGRMTGYAGGIRRKEFLLSLERPL
ncbi:MAG: methylated-DNA--[protein]-cysteine S-methyltransferase [Candidatus Methanomethylophilaceae archaeon]